jgi:hypothetical protein
MSDNVVQFKDKDDLASFLVTFPREVTQDIHDELVDIAQIYRKTVDQKMKNTTKDTSKRYKRGSKYHSPSKPYFPPAIDSGNLRSGMVVERIISGAMFAVYNAPYVKWLEPIGSERKGMKPRPVFFPTFLETENDNIRRIINTVDKRISR